MVLTGLQEKLCSFHESDIPHKATKPQQATSLQRTKAISNGNPWYTCRLFQYSLRQTITIKYELKNLVLVIDPSTLVLISNLFKVAELVGKKVTFIERLDKDRKKLEHHALYFINPTVQNIDRLIKDFENKDKPQYRKVHILFTTFMDKSILKKIASEKNLLKKIAKNSIK